MSVHAIEGRREPVPPDNGLRFGNADARARKALRADFDQRPAFPPERTSCPKARSAKSQIRASESVDASHRSPGTLFVIRAERLCGPICARSGRLPAFGRDIRPCGRICAVTLMLNPCCSCYIFSLMSAFSCVFPVYMPLTETPVFTCEWGFCLLSPIN